MDDRKRAPYVPPDTYYAVSELEPNYNIYYNFIWWTVVGVNLDNVDSMVELTVRSMCSDLTTSFRIPIKAKVAGEKFLGARPEIEYTENGQQHKVEIDNSFKQDGVPLRRFYLNRIKDETGVSRTGRVLEGCVTQSGKVFVEWRPPHSTIGIYNSFEEFKTIHVDCHPSCNQVVFLDCHHPDYSVEHVAYVSQKVFDALSKAGITEVCGSLLTVDEMISDNLVHFPAADGTCNQYNV